MARQAPGIGGEQGFVTVLGAGEGMVAGAPALVLLVVFEHREIDHPQRSPGRAVDVALVVADLGAQRAECVVDDFGLVGAEENQVAGLRAGALDDGFQRSRVKVLDDGRLQAFFVQFRCVIDLDVGQSPGAVDPDELGIGVDLAAGQRVAPLAPPGTRSAATRPPDVAGPLNTLKATSFTASVTSVSSSVTRRSGLSEP